MNTCYIGLGSNLDVPLAQVREAIHRLGAIPEFQDLVISNFYQTESWGPVEQNDFINAVVVLKTSLSAEDVFTHLQAIEMQMGRKRVAQRYGPRVIDLDLLLCGDLVLNTLSLSLPHPNITERRFVLQPLSDLSPRLMLPGSSQTVVDLLEQCAPARCVKVEV